MLEKDFIELINKFFNDRMELAAKKGADYATEDKLSNFKRNGATLNSIRIPELFKKDGALSFALLLTIMKIDRVINLLLKNDGKAQNESIEDTFKDLANYVDLAYAIYKENHSE